jgi:hypothetical protein
MLNRFLLIIPLAIPLCGYSQGYADSPFYKIVSAFRRPRVPWEGKVYALEQMA